jgi:lysophospholipase L1-like esterase
MTHIVLLGDSVFDNGAYVGSGPDTIGQLRNALPAGGRATLLAQDGAMIADLPAQQARVPADATHLVVSVGGNDALRDSHVLDEPVRTVGEALHKLASVRDAFGADYRSMLEQVLSRHLPVAVCTIYDPRFADALQRRIASTALSVINDAISRETFRRKVALIDLRVICDNDDDFANPIEPSVQGGAKIARAICEWAANADVRRSVVIAG